MNEIDHKRFYAELGKLLYAVCDVDKVISPEEKKELQKIVREELVPHEKHTDQFGTSAAHYAEIEFDFLDEQIIDSQTALQSFLDYIEDHRRLLDERMRKTCIVLAQRLADVYSGRSKKEQQLLILIKSKLTA
jgi:hypothetical protein